MGMDGPPPEIKMGAPEWMTTFADLMSLLLTFFVLLLSFSNTEVVKFKTMMGSVREAFGLRSEFDIMDKPTGSQQMPMPAPTYSKQPTKVETVAPTVVKLRDALEKSELKDSGNVEVTEKGVTLRLEGDAVFESGKTALKPGVLKLLDELVEIANTSPGHIEVEGHTDNVPIRSSRFPSNWELSAGRAGAAVRYLTDKGLPPDRLKAIGFGETIPLAPNDSAKNRAKNRRVEFLFVTENEEKEGTEP